MKHEAGISLYPDMTSAAATQEYVKKAASMRYRRVFLSMILDSLNFAGAAKPDAPVFAETVALCSQNGLSVWCDLDDSAIAYFGGLNASLVRLAEIGLKGVRIDSGLSAEEMAEITRHPSGLHLQLNCAGLRADRPNTVQEAEHLFETIRREGDLSRVEACFNFYPRVGTGIAESSIRGACEVLHRFGIRISAFVASRTVASLLHAPSRGVPTAERLRYADPYTAGRILTFLGVNDVLFGDGCASDAELAALLAALSDPSTRLRVRFDDAVPQDVIAALSKMMFENRADEPVGLLRGTASRGIALEPFGIRRGTYGDVTIDNTTSAQYAGELQILLEEQPPLSFANVVGRVHEDDFPLLPYLRDAAHPYRIEQWMEE